MATTAFDMDELNAKIQKDVDYLENYHGRQLTVIEVLAIITHYTKCPLRDAVADVVSMLPGKKKRGRKKLSPFELRFH